MMRLLTGVTTFDSFAFQLTRVQGIGNRVFVEGEAQAARGEIQSVQAGRGGSAGQSSKRVFWVHIWTLTDERITQLREYSNTAILVTDLKPTTPTAQHPCLPLWQNQLWKSEEGRELPGLILAI